MKKIHKKYVNFTFILCNNTFDFPHVNVILVSVS